MPKSMVVSGIPNKHELVNYVPCMPSLSSANLPWLIGSRADREFRFQFWLRSISRFRQLRWVLCNSFNALEHSIITTFPKEAGICPVGPFLPQQKKMKEKMEKDGCLQWLDKQALGSVIYVSFGSSIVLKEKQVEEVALALEKSGRPFLWVVRGIEKFLSAEYLERNGERKYILSWAPQMSVLLHRSVGCFVTHCGWNSTVESITAGVPMICWPCVADQFLNCAYVVDNIWKIGLALSANDEGIVEKVEIEECLRRIMATEEGTEIRRRAHKLKECAVNATSRSSSIKFTAFLNAMKTSEGG
ncbi:hypothetical protein SUGI_1027230 [Cryptomeria japonica]|nr:hypothetical protein SUGI_1027230 [Cryptomeria japonica]